MKLTAKLELGAPVIIKWRDSGFFHGWRYDDGPTSLPEICSLGYITYIGDAAIEIASTRIGKNAGVLNPLAIPIGAIESIEVIEGLDGD